METGPSRRELIAGGAAIGGLLVLGYGASTAFDRFRSLGCPAPPDGEELDYTEDRVDRSLVATDAELGVMSPAADLAVIRSDEEVTALQMDAFPKSTREFVETTDFDHGFLIAVHPPDSGNSSIFHITGVERQDEEEVHSYSCSTQRSSEDISCGCSWLIRVDADFTPIRAAHTHEGGFGEQTIETGD